MLYGSLLKIASGKLMYENLIFKYIYSLKCYTQSVTHNYYMYKECTEMLQNVSDVMEQFYRTCQNKNKYIP